MRKRIQGTEHEYTLFCRKMNAMGIDPHSIALDLLRESDLHSFGEFLRNQSRAYYDVGHLELSTCEVSNFRDLVIWEKAVEKIVDWLRKVMEEKYCSHNIKIWAFKNNTSPDGTSYGSHENYCVSREVKFPERFIKELVPHLTTRIIYTGAGDLIDDKYVLSPSAYLTSCLISGETMRDTGILNTRDEPHASNYRRLHLLVGDALMNETALMLRQFTTSSVLQLMEMKKLKNVPELKNPLEDMWKNVEVTNPDNWKVTLKDGKTVSPIDIQRFYLEKIEEILENDWERKAFKSLEEVLNHLEGRNSKELTRRVEWLDRFFAIKEAVANKEGPDVEMMACKQYSEIGEDRSLFHRRQRSGLLDRIVSDEEILQAVYNPPKDTRAYLRKALCDRYEVDFIDWSVMIVNDGGRKRIELKDPYATRLGEANAAA